MLIEKTSELACGRQGIKNLGGLNLFQEYHFS
jgi:hypothetical protein